MVGESDYGGKNPGGLLLAVRSCIGLCGVVWRGGVVGGVSYFAKIQGKEMVDGGKLDKCGTGRFIKGVFGSAFDVGCSWGVCNWVFVVVVGV